MTSTARIVVTGSESTGKTVLSQQLALRVGALWVPEFSRLYADAVRRPLTADDVEPIARGQVSVENAALSAQPAAVVYDTDLVSTVVYARHYYGDCPPWIVDTARRRLADLYLLLDIDLPWAPDGVRDRPGARRDIQALFRRQLHEFGARTMEIAGTDVERLENAWKFVRQYREAGS